MTIQRKRPVWLGVAFLLALTLVWTPAAGAQGQPDDRPPECPPREGYPDGCPPPSTDPKPDPPECGTEQTVVEAGGTVEVTVAGVSVGATLRVLLGGTEVARATAQGIQGFVPLQTEVTDVTTSFTIPADLEPGTYPLVAVVANFTLACGDDGLEVLAAGSEGGGGGLAFTGASLAGLVALALALLVVGYVLIRRSRRNRTA